MSRRRSGRSIVLAASVFAALGDATRLELVARLNDGQPRCIAQLAEGLDLTRQGVTKHLHVLAAAGVIDGSRLGREQVWALNTSRIADAQRHLDLIAREWDDVLSRLKAHIEQE